VSEEKKHGLYKVVTQADKLARIVMDQLAKDGCGNLENIRDAMLPALTSAELDHREEVRLGDGNRVISEASRKAAADAVMQPNRIYERLRDKGAVVFAPVPEAPEIGTWENVRTGVRVYSRTYRGAKFWTRHADCWLINGPCDRDRLERLFNGYVDAARAGMPLTFFINEDWHITPKGELITGLQAMKEDFER
jgi:hypothetical protein